LKKRGRWAAGQMIDAVKQMSAERVVRDVEHVPVPPVFPDGFLSNHHAAGSRAGRA